MKRTDFFLAICLLGISGLIVAKAGFWRPGATSQVVANPASAVQESQDDDKKAHLALLKKYSKGSPPAYVAPDAGQSTTDTTANEAADAPLAQPYDPSPAPTAPATSAPAPTTSPRAMAPSSTTTETQDDGTDTADYSVPYPGPVDATPPVPYDDYTRALAGSQLGDPWNASDQQLLDGMTGLLDENQRNTFQNMWSTMTPDEQAQWLYELRTMLQP